MHFHLMHDALDPPAPLSIQNGNSIESAAFPQYTLFSNGKIDRKNDYETDP